MKKKKRLIHSLTFNITFATVVLLFVFCIIVSTVGYLKFTDSLTKEYTDSALRTGDTAITLVNADNVQSYLDNKDDILSDEGGALKDEYYLTLNRLNTLCDKQNTTVIYVIKVDTSDYKNYVSVFNCPNKTSGYTPWVLGEVKNTSKTDGNTYETVYKQLYDKTVASATVMRTENLNGALPHVTLLLPIENSESEVVALMCVQRPMAELTEGRRSYIIIVACFTAVFAALFVVVSTLFMKKQFVNPLKKINAEAARFASENSAPETPFTGRVGRINEITELAESVSTMERETLKYIENLSAAISEKQRIGTELNIASEIQKGLVPFVFPAFPERKEFDLFALMEPAKEVGGDFYDFFFIDDNRLALVMADVSGKGIPAALFMMVTKILIHEFSLSGKTPAEILALSNDRICENNKAEMFVTVWLGILDLSTGKLTFANAGHDDPAVYSADGEFTLNKYKHGLVLGAMSGSRYVNGEIVMNKGDKIFLYTDGVPEATDKDGKLFTLNKMLDALNLMKAAAPEKIIKTVREKVDEFTGDAPQFDDITMLCAEYNGKSVKTLKLPATEENLVKVNDFIKNSLKGVPCGDKTLRKIELFTEEVFVNIARYAYAPAVGDAEIKIETSDGKVRITFIDQGKPYNPLRKPDPDVGLPADSREIGGLGIFMTKKLADRIGYEYKDGKNILMTEKNFE